MQVGDCKLEIVSRPREFKYGETQSWPMFG